MPDEPATPDDSDLEFADRVAAADALNRLCHALVGHRSDVATLQRIARAADRLAREIEQQPSRVRREEMARSSRFLGLTAKEGALRSVVGDGAFVDMFSDSPVSGSANPLSIGLRIRSVGDEAEGIVTLRAGWEGAPGRSHGGVVAACVDETIGGLLPVIGQIAFTGELSLRFEAPCPLGVPLRFRAWLERREGRKLFISCTGEHDDEIFVRATSVFIAVDLDQFRELADLWSVSAAE